MAYALLLAFVAVPILEIAIFIQVGGAIGLFPTLGLVVLTAVAGTTLLRMQGFRILESARATIQAGGFPAKQLFDGACLLVGGVLLLTPGFFTDAVGLLLLLPPVREVLRAAGMRHVHGRYGRPGADGSTPFYGTDRDGGGRDSSPWGRAGSGPVIEGEYDAVDPQTPESLPRRPAPDDHTPDKGDPR